MSTILLFLTIGAIGCGLGLVTVIVYSLSTAGRRSRLSRDGHHPSARRLGLLLLTLGTGTGLFLAGAGIADVVAGAERHLEAWMQVAVGLGLAASYALLYYAKRHHPELLHKPADVLPTRLDELDGRLGSREDVEALLAEGHRIQAVKLYRDGTGASLSEAVAGVDRMSRQMTEAGTWSIDARQAHERGDPSPG